MVGMRSIQATSSPSATTDDLIELPQRASSSAGGMFAAMGTMQGADSNPSTSSYSQVMQEMEEEPFGGYGVIARGEQEYMSWTLPGSNYASAALTKEYTGFVDPPSNSAGDQSLHTDLAVFKEYTQMATSPVPNPVTVGWSSHQRSSSSSTLETLLGQVHHLSPSGTLDVDPHIMPHQGLAAGLESSQIQWNLDLELAAVSGQFEAPVGNLLLQPHGGHNLVGIPSQMPNPPAGHHAEILNLYNLGGKGPNAQPQSFQASGSTRSSHLPSTSAPRDHHSFQIRHDSSRSPFRSYAQMDRMQSRLPQQQFLSSSTSSGLQGQPPGTTVDAHAKPQGHLIQTWVRNWQEKRWQQQQQQQDLEVELGGEDARSPQTIARDEHQAVKHMRAERARRKIFNSRLQTLKSLVPIIHKKVKFFLSSPFLSLASHVHF